MTEFIDRAREEFYEAKKAVREARKAFKQSPDAGFVRTMQDAISQYLEARRGGVTRDDAVKGLEEELRGVWPKPTTKFAPNCDACSDTGYRDMTCWHEQRCARKRCHEMHPGFEHAYVTPCECSAGDKMRPKVRTTYAEDAITQVGKRKRKSGGWRQVGG